MADKKKKKLKLKQKQKQNQSQQVIINVSRASQPRTTKPKQQLISSPQPPPMVQYVYRDNLALNMLNDRARTQAPVAAAPANLPLVQQQPVAQQIPRILPQPNTPPPASIITRVLQNNKIHNSTSVPQENKKPIIHDFEKILNSKKAFQEENEKQSDRNDDTATSQASIPNAIRMTNKGLPYRKTREEKAAYIDYMETVVGNKPANERTKDEAKAYNEYLNSQGKPRADEGQQSIEPFLRPAVSRKPKKIQPVDFDTVDEDEINRVLDDEEEFIFSPLKRKPT